MFDKEVLSLNYALNGIVEHAVVYCFFRTIGGSLCFGSEAVFPLFIAVGVASFGSRMPNLFTTGTLYSTSPVHGFFVAGGFWVLHVAV